MSKLYKYILVAFVLVLIIAQGFAWYTAVTNITKYSKTVQQLTNINEELNDKLQECLSSKQSVQPVKVIEVNDNKCDISVDQLSGIIEHLQPKLSEPLRKLIAKTILEVCEEQNVDPLLVVSLIYEESNFRPLVQSKAGAVGLMQVRFSTWKEHPILKDNGVSVKNKLFWIDNNIKCGVKILSKYIKEAKGNIVVALNRYHTGLTKPKGKSYELRYVTNILIRYYNLQQLERNININ